MLQNIAAVERDGMDVRVLTITLEIPDSTFDTAAAVKAACTDYCTTEEGLRIYEGNCGCFNWGDFVCYVPNEICEKYGFSKHTNDIVSDLEVDWDEHLVNDDHLTSDEEECLCQM